jgi:hypothetical protein
MRLEVNGQTIAGTALNGFIMIDPQKSDAQVSALFP